MKIKQKTKPPSINKGVNFTKPIKTNVNFDWFQFSCFGSLESYKTDKLVLQDIRTTHFNNYHIYYLNNNPFLHIYSNPSSSILKKDLIIIKVDNFYLYKSNITKNVKRFLDIFKLKFNKFTRLDLCCDFNKFDNNLMTQDFINNFLCNKIVKNNKTKVKIIGSHDRINTYDYIKFGSNTSNCVSYLYNKSKELKEVKFKSWIYEHWQQYNFDLKNEDIWRLEFSLKQFDFILVNKIDSDIDLNNLTLDNVECYKTTLFVCLLNKYFDFRINAGDTNKSRLIPYILFTDFNTQEIIKFEYRCLMSNKYTYYMYKYIERQNDIIRKYKKNSLHDYNNLLHDLKELYFPYKL